MILLSLALSYLLGYVLTYSLFRDAGLGESRRTCAALALIWPLFAIVSIIDIGK